MTGTFALVAGLIGLALAALARLKPLRLLARLQGTLVFFGLAALAFWAVRLVRPDSSGEQFAAAATLLALGFLAVRLVSLGVFESLGRVVRVQESIGSWMNFTVQFYQFPSLRGGS